MQKKLLFSWPEPVYKTDFHCIFSEIKNSDPEKVLFSQNFMSFYRSQKKIWSAVSVFHPKTAFFAAKTDFHFIFSEIQNLDPEQSPFFVEFHEFL